MTSPSGVELARMRRKHLRQVLVIERASYPRPWSRGLFLTELANRATRGYWVGLEGAEGGGEGPVLGYGGVMMAGDEGHVTNLAVDPERRGLGIATRLLLQLTVDALTRGARRMTLEVRVSNERAIRLYARFGYLPVGRRKNYYPDSKEDAIIMTVPEVVSQEYLEKLQTIAASVPGPTIVEQPTTLMPG